MKYNFSGIFDAGMYESVRVMIAAGPYSVFSNMVVDRLRDMCRGEIELDSGVDEIFEEFGMDKLSEADTTASLPLEQFFDMVKSPALSGKWFCSVDFSEIHKKQRETLDRYIKNPSPYGVLVVTMKDFPDYIKMLRSTVMNNSKYSHILQLSFPSRKALHTVVEEMLAERGATATNEAVKLFILRMSNCYEEYQQRIDEVVQNYGGSIITQKDMAEALKGIENFVLDDFVQQLTVPVKNTKVVKNRRINRMLRMLVEEYGAISLVRQLRKKVNDAIQMRLIINEGIVPIRVRYSATEAKSKIEEGNRLKNMNDYSFKRLAQVASLTSLRDWLFMKMILSTPKTEYVAEEYERALYALVNRTAFSNDRLENIVGVIDNLRIQPELYMSIMSRKEVDGS